MRGIVSQRMCMYSRRHRNSNISVPSRPVPFKQKVVPIPFDRKMGMEREAEQVTNGTTDYVNHS